MHQTVAGRIRFAREKTGITTRELAELAGMSPSHPSLLEMGKRSPSGETAVLLAQVFGVTTDWLLRGIGKEPTERGLRAAVERARRQLKAS